MHQYVDLVIDGSKVQGRKGETVLDTALRYGICIPHLCHMPTLTDIGACRLCIVDHIKNGRTKITT
jgi:NADH dehydrogenase/NADH:ubiquinone oxidoreductase subunit G